LKELFKHFNDFCRDILSELQLAELILPSIQSYLGNMREGQLKHMVLRCVSCRF